MVTIVMFGGLPVFGAFSLLLTLLWIDDIFDLSLRSMGISGMMVRYTGAQQQIELAII